MLHLDYRDAKPIYAQIADGIRQQVSLGILQQGEKLPSVREMAVELSINPNTIQRAYRELEMDGWITTVAGKGCFVCREPLGNPREEVRLLNTFEETVRRLYAMGYTRQELEDRLEQEENHA